MFKNKRTISLINRLIQIIIFILIPTIIYFTLFKKSFVNLDHLISKKRIDNLNNYLINEKKIYSWSKEKFIAKKQVHANKISLTECNKCNELHGHYEERINRGNPFYHIPNNNFYKLPELNDFIKDLNIFDDIGNIVIIINKPNEDGIEHFDHNHKWVSEFVWIRTNDLKQFYVKDNLGIPHYVNCNLIWFDDQRVHNIYPASSNSFSIRVDGKFNSKFRKYIAKQNNFKKSENKQTLLDQKDLIFNEPK
jgi:hypothetical protein